MAVIKAINVSKVHPRGCNPVVALDPVSLSFEKFEFSFIIGPLDSGKTTLLNIIGGLAILLMGKYT